jgi:Flp pilus assembly protein TadG
VTRGTAHRHGRPGGRQGRGPGRRSLRDQGFVTVWTVALSFSCISLIGLVHDAGRALRARSDAFGTAAAAARAGAQEIDRAAAVLGDTRLDEQLALQTAASYLSSRGVQGEVSVADMDVTVTVTDTTDLQILPGSVTVNATATAHAAQGQTPP